MIAGAIAFLVYAISVSYSLLHHKWNTGLVTVLSMSVWVCVAFALRYLCLSE
jgi:hypothetical protein